MLHRWVCRDSRARTPAGRALRCTAKAWHVALWKAKGKMMFCSALSDGTILLMPWTKAGFIRSTWLPTFPQWHPEWNLGWLDDEDVQVSETGMTLTALNSCYRVTVIHVNSWKVEASYPKFMGRGFSSIFFFFGRWCNIPYNASRNTRAPFQGFLVSSMKEVRNVLGRKFKDSVLSIWERATGRVSYG